MKILARSDSRNKQYEDYLSNHITNVKAVWNDILKPEIMDDDELDDEFIDMVDTLIDEHDDSKYDAEEWDGYLNNFYPDKDNPLPKDEVNNGFKLAWLHHLHNNPHHWNYWILLDDDGSGKPEPIDMPLAHILCMLSDWASFRYGNKDNPGKTGEEDTTRDWYEAQKANQILTDVTKDLIEKYIDLLP